MRNLTSLGAVLAVAIVSARADVSQILANSAPEATFLEGKEGWRFLPAELRHLAADGQAPRADAIDAVADFHRQLADKGIRLLVVPVPPKARIHPDKAGLAEGGSDRAVVEALRTKGVEVISLEEAFRATGRPMYLQRDTHWNPDAISLAAGAIAEVAGRQGELQTQIRREKSSVTGDLGGDPEDVDLALVSASGAAIPTDKSSPVLVLGDSHVLAFHEGGDMLGVGGGLPDHLAAALGLPVDVLGVRGSGATSARVALARRARADASYLTGKKLVVWCLGAREFTQADAWKLIPLVKE